MPSYTIELHPAVDPAPDDVKAQQEQTYTVCNPSQLLRELAEIEGRFPGAQVRGIVLTRRERVELMHTMRTTDKDATSFCGIPILEWTHK